MYMNRVERKIEDRKYEHHIVVYTSRSYQLYNNNDIYNKICTGLWFFRRAIIVYKTDTSSGT